MGVPIVSPASQDPMNRGWPSCSRCGGTHHQVHFSIAVWSVEMLLPAVEVFFLLFLIGSCNQSDDILFMTALCGLHDSTGDLVSAWLHHDIMMQRGNMISRHVNLVAQICVFPS